MLHLSLYTGEAPVAQPIHVLSVRQLNEAQLQRLRAVSPRLEVRQQSIASAEEFAQVLTPDTEVLYTFRGNFDLRLAPALRWVQVDSAGVNALYGTPLWQSNILITSANGVHAIQIGEYVLAVLLAHGHRLPLAQHLQARGEWARGEQNEAFTPMELRGATLGILGYGAIGREVARLAHAFGMRILATKRPDRPARFDGWTPPGTGDPDGTLPEHFYALDELPDLLGACDAVVIALPLTAGTHHLIGAAELAAMRPHAILVNIARGAIIDQEALIAALREHRIGGAALDVTDPEPLPAESPLWAMDTVIITPHVSGQSRFYDDRAVELFAENLRRYLNGEPLLNLVQRAQGY
jgi:phosphoglycerate dehydrogenase-like enzyme